MDISDVEFAVITKTWEIPMGDPEGSGQVILHRYFQKYPDNMEYFDQFRGKPLDDIKDEPMFKTHAGRIVRAFNNAIKVAEERGKEAILNKASWDKLAVSHEKRHIPKESFLALKEVVLDVLTEVCQLNEFQKGAWNKLLSYLFGVFLDHINELEQNN